MRFFARIRPNSPIDRAWRANHRTGGHIEGVQFSLVPGANVLATNPTGGTYRTDLLAEDEVALLRPNPGVDLEVFSHLTLVPPPLVMATEDVTDHLVLRDSAGTPVLTGTVAGSTSSPRVTPTPAPTRVAPGRSGGGRTLTSGGGSPQRKS